MGKEVYVLMVSDLHDNIKGLEKLKNWVSKFKPQLIISAGDITSLNVPDQIERYKNFLKTIGWPKQKVWAIEGNNEQKQTAEWLKSKKIYLKEKHFYGFRWVGIGGWGETTPALKPFDQKTILITHMPPQNISKHINTPKFHFFGHLHRPFLKRKLSNLTLVQIPPLINQQALLFILPSEKIKLLD
ncbi:metallophosphoesterase family protein [bacterium]|nr:metallophosphoesterase family protein [bacterium]